jgi:16S rRNA (cytosine1402-N4)-methyltransferase
MSGYHTPVMLSEILEWLSPQPGQILIDGTAGGGGHSKALAERVGPHGRVLAIDQDGEALAECAKTLVGLPATLWRGNFAQLGQALEETKLGPVHGILLDLGVSSHQLDTAERGFALRYNGPLDMRMNTDSDQESAAELLNRLPEAEIARLLFEYGDAFSHPSWRDSPGYQDLPRDSDRG